MQNNDVSLTAVFMCALIPAQLCVFKTMTT